MGDPQADISNKIKEADRDSNDTKFTTHTSSLSSSSQPPPPSSSSSPFSLGEFVFGGKGYFGKFSANQRNYRLQQCMELQLALEDCEKRLRRRKVRAAQRAAKVDQPSTSSSSSEASWNRWFSSGDSNSTTTVGTDENAVMRKKKKKKKKKNQEKSSSSSSSNPPRIEDSKSGKKISLFYDWGLTGRAGAGPPATATAAATVGVGSVVAEPTENTIEKTKATNRERSNKKSCSMENHAVWACRAMALGCAPDLIKLRKCFKNDLGTTNPEGCYYENGDDGEGTEVGRCQLEQRIVAECVLRQEKELKDRLDG